MQNDTSVPEVATPINQETPTITVTVPDNPSNSCQSCKPEFGKTIPTTENGLCVVCGSIVILRSDNLTDAPQPVSEDIVASSDTIHAAELNETQSSNVDNSDNQPQNQTIPTEEKSEAIQGEIVEVKNKGGRPTKYNEEILRIAKSYYDRCSGKADGKKRMPFIEELAIECDVDGDTIVEWAKDEDKLEFSATYKKLMNLQKLRTVQQGYGAKNPTFAIFMLKANHGMMESEKRIITGERNSDPMQVTINDYKSAEQQLPSSVAQQVIEEGSE